MFKVSTSEGDLYNASEEVGDAYWVNTKGWFEVATPVREPGDEIICTYGRYIGAVAFVLFEDERDAMMFKLSLK